MAAFDVAQEWGRDTYAFLDPRFTRLRGRIAIDDPQRVDTRY
jgi:hypothetical protein